MKWLQDNPLGVALLGINALFLLLAAVLAVVWTLPVAVETTDKDTRGGAVEVALVAHPIGPLSDFQVINEKPVFNQSRLPVIGLQEGDASLQAVANEIEDAPEARLTGVIITPSLRIASLMPAKGEQKSVMAHEGQPMTGQFVGWQVSSVQPRNVVLESRDGRKMELELQVNDTKLKEPPKPAPVAKTGSGVAVLTDGGDGQPLSRAEQIRQRIAQRREELRREQDSQQAQNHQQAGRQAGQDRRASKPQNYKSAIQALMKSNRKDKPGNGNKDG